MGKLTTYHNIEDVISFYTQEEQGTCHTEYYHYTTVKNAENILERQRLRLTDLSKTSNDTLEEKWYGDNGQYLYSLCFSTGTSESLPLWFLYSGINGKGVRIGFKKNQIIKLLNAATFELVITSKKSPYRYLKTVAILKPDDFELKFNDILYIGKDTKSREKYRIKHNGQTLNNISESDRDHLVNVYGAFTKSLIWFYEKETRLQVEIKNEKLKTLIAGSKNNFAVEMDLSLLKHKFAVRVAPECSEEEKEKISKLAGFNQFKASKIQPSDHAGEIKIDLTKDFCKKCKSKLF